MTDLNAERIAEYQPVEAGIATLRQKYGSLVWDVSTPKGLDAAKAARAEVREPRYEIERVRKALKAPAIAYGKRIDDEAKRITSALLEIETPIDEAIKAEEDRREAAKAAKEAAEKARIEAVQQKIADIRALANLRPGVSAEQIDKTWAELTDRELSEADFAEFLEQAKRAQAETVEALHLAYEDAHAREQEAARMAAEREELTRLRREQEERDRIAKAERAAEEAAAKAKRDEEQSALQRQRDEIAKAQADIDRQKREQAEAEREAAAREAQRIAAEKAEADRKAAHEAEQARIRADRIARASKRPDDRELACVISEHYQIELDAAFGWLATFGQEKAA